MTLISIKQNADSFVHFTILELNCHKIFHSDEFTKVRKLHEAFTSKDVTSFLKKI